MTNRETSHLRFWSEQLAAVGSVARNELTQQTRYRINLMLDLFSPILALAPIILTAYFLTSGRESRYLAETIGLPDHFTFIMLGYLAFSVLGLGNPIMHYTGTAWSWRSLQETGVLERNLVAPVSREALVIGMGVYYSGLYLFHFAYILAASVLVFGLDLELSGPGIAYAAVLLALMTTLAVVMGFVLSAVSLVLRDFSAVTLVIHRPFLLLSGAYFLVELVPQPFRFIAMTNPLAYATEPFGVRCPPPRFCFPLVQRSQLSEHRRS